MDVSSLQPGELWNEAIAHALESSIGFLFFLSPRSIRSELVSREIAAAAKVQDRLIIPVVLHEPLDVPADLRAWQYIRLVGRASSTEIEQAVAHIADATERYLRETPAPRPAVSAEAAPALAASIAQEVRIAAEAPAEPGGNSIFVVHGHDTKALAELEKFLASVGVAGVVLSRQDESAQSLFQKFMSVGSQARFAIVLLCADDYGASRQQYDVPKVGDRALQFRARQNVILELGFFYGKLGWENVFVVYREPDQPFPNFERPSDLGGVVFASMSDAGWQKELKTKLSQAGFNLRPSPLPAEAKRRARRSRAH
jgi:predicted nucleotide-binding protein